MDAAAAEFVLKEAPKVDSAFRANRIFDSQRVEIRARKPIHDLEDALQRYQNSDLKLKLNPQSCTWSDIIEAFEIARDEYDRKAQGFIGLARKVWRTTGNNAHRIMPLLELIPEDMGLRTLRGGLAFIVTMARESARKREAILSAFADIPLHFGLAERKRRLYPDNVALKTCSILLHDELMQAIPRLVTHLLPKKRFNLFPLVLKVPTEEDVDKILATIKLRLDALKQQVEDIHDEMIAGLSKTSQVTRDLSFQIKSTADQTYKMMQVAQDYSFEIKATADQTKESMDIVKGEVDKLQENFGLLLENGVFQFLREMPIQQERNNFPLGFHQGPVASHITTITMEQLYTVLNIPLEGLLIKDLEGALGADKLFGCTTQYQSADLMQNSRFRRWYQSTENDVLLIDGSAREVESTTSRITPLSNICAILAAAAHRSGAAPLAFFCGLHTSQSDAVRGPNGIVRALIAVAVARLSWSRKLNLDFVETQDYLQALQEHQLPVLCHTLGELIRQFSHDTNVYCVVDGITWCEQFEWLDDLRKVLDSIVRMAQDLGQGPVVKVLLTCPVRSRETIHHFPFNMREHQIVLSDHQGYELEYDPGRLMELTARNMLYGEAQRRTVGACVDDMEEDYT